VLEQALLEFEKVLVPGGMRPSFQSAYSSLHRLPYLIMERVICCCSAASTASFLLRLTYAFTSLAGISRTSWPSFLSSRAQ